LISSVRSSAARSSSRAISMSASAARAAMCTAVLGMSDDPPAVFGSQPAGWGY
jgi:hypothetical protein